MVDFINSCNKGMSALVGTVNVSANLNNVNIKDCEQRKHEWATRIVETNLRRTSTRQIKILVTRREDFLCVQCLNPRTVNVGEVFAPSIPPPTYW
jgi:hypothetical protein